MKLKIRHYWAKTDNLRYGSEYQQLAIELTVVVILVPIIVYCSQYEGLGFFVIGLLFPAVMFALSFFITLSGIIRERKEGNSIANNEKNHNKRL